MDKITFEELTGLEPELQTLLNEAREITARGLPDFCANYIWYKQFKRRLVTLVGWYAKRRILPLTTPAAYDLAHKTIYEALPDCRHESPLCLC